MSDLPIHNGFKIPGVVIFRIDAAICLAASMRSHEVVTYPPPVMVVAHSGKLFTSILKTSVPQK
jgi:hypothetical protein